MSSAGIWIKDCVFGGELAKQSMVTHCGRNGRFADVLGFNADPRHELDDAQLTVLKPINATIVKWVERVQEAGASYIVT